MSNGAVFSPSNQRVVFNGVSMVGRAAGTGFSWSYNVTNQVQVIAGMDGDSYIVMSEDFTATGTLNLLPTSVENTILTNAFQALRASPNGLLFSLTVSQGPLGTGTSYSGFCVPAGIPPMDFADGATTNVWTLLMTRFEGKTVGLPPAPLAP